VRRLHGDAAGRLTRSVLPHRRRESGSDRQIHFSAPEIDITQWFTVGFELIAGKSFKWLVNGVQPKPDNADTLKRDGFVGADGMTVISPYVPNYPQRIVLQLEDGGGPSEEANVQYDWVTAGSLAA
jgi:hypothetical protein